MLPACGGRLWRCTLSLCRAGTFVTKVLWIFRLLLCSLAAEPAVLRIQSSCLSTLLRPSAGGVREARD